MRIKTYPKVYYQDATGKMPLKFIQVYGTRYEFQYDENGDIVLQKVI